MSLADHYAVLDSFIEDLEAGKDATELKVPEHSGYSSFGHSTFGSIPSPVSPRQANLVAEYVMLLKLFCWYADPACYRKKEEEEEEDNERQKLIVSDATIACRSSN